MKKNKTTKVTLPATREELLQDSLTREKSKYYSTNKGRDPLDIVPAIPLSRFVEVGDKVQVGNLTNCVVALVDTDRKFVVIDYISINNNHGNPISTPAIGCWPWYDVYKAEDIQDTHFMKSGYALLNRLTTTALSGLLHKVLYFGVDSDPEFQRGYVWTEQDEVNLIDSVFNDRDIGKFIFLKYNWPRTDVDVLDGKQRLNALVRFTTSAFPYKGLYWHQLSRLDRQQFADHHIQYAEIDASNFTEADKIRLFLNVNVAGVPQSEDHLLILKKRLAELTTEGN